MLTANMVFLAIQSVDNGGNPTPHRSVAQVASYISIVTSLGSILLSLLLLHQNRSKKNNAAEAVSLSTSASNSWSNQASCTQAWFLGNMNDGRGLQTLAILYALPSALLMWS